MSEGPRSPLGTTGFKPCSPSGEFSAPDRPITKETPKKPNHTPLGSKLLRLFGFQTTGQTIRSLQKQLQAARQHRQEVAGYSELGDGQSDFPAMRHPGDERVLAAIDTRITNIQSRIDALQTPRKR